jgi:hypothetical protein
MSELVSETSPLLVELVGLFFISILVTGLIVYTDIRFHDDYVKDLIGRCHPENQEDVCVEKRKQFGLAEDAQIELGQPYWEVLMVQYIVIPIGFAGFRLLTILVRKRKLTGLRIFIVILWGLIPLILLSAGIIDIFYFVGRGLEIPETLEWLNFVGFLEHTKVLGNDPVNVERGDLIFTFTLGVLFIVLLFFIALKMYQTSRLRGMV